VSLLPPCPRCLLSEIDGQTVYRSVKAYVDSLPEELRAPAELVRSRLAVCKSCDCLLSGMCVKCGCFVEARAAKAVQHCPFAPSKW